jgi:intracellular septation protein A
MKSWSVFWRLLLVCIALGLVFGIVVNAAYAGNVSTTAVRWKPTFFWWLFAIFFWVTASVSPSFLETLLFGRKLKFTPESWLKIGRYAALLLLVLGVANQIVFELSTSAWIIFKLAAVPVGLALLSLVLGSQIKQTVP